MGILDNLGDQVAQHKDQIGDTIDKGGDFVDEKTGGKYAEHVDKGQDFLKSRADQTGGQGDAAADANPQGVQDQAADAASSFGNESGR